MIFRTPSQFYDTAGLQAEKDAESIVYRIACIEFPFDGARAMELATFRTFAVPSISSVLYQSGGFMCAPQRRMDSTDILLSHIIEYGYNSQKGEAAISRINEIHSQFNLKNMDMLYVLSTFIVEPIRWMSTFAYRPLHIIEQNALYYFWKAIGERLNIAKIPKSLDLFIEWNRRYEKEHFIFHKDNHALAVRTREHIFEHVLPKSLRRFGPPIFHSFLDRPLLEACGLPIPPVQLRYAIQRLMRLNSRIGSLKTAKPHFRTKADFPSFKGGYEIESVGNAPTGLSLGESNEILE
jgi:hypothetical protein